MDADVRLEPEALARMVAFMQESQADLGSGIPQQVTGSFWERLVIPQIHFLLLGFLPIRRARKRSRPAYGAGCGQLFIARRVAYERSGGHGAIRASRHDGIKLPRLFRRMGFKTDLFDATAVATCRMYRKGGEVWRGFMKNATKGLGAPTNMNVDDIVQSWQTGPNAPILFEVTVPPETPPGDSIYIQFNSFGWTPPIPMWSKGNNQWAYRLSGPLNILGSFGYRYCRDAQCGSADDAQTAGGTTQGHIVTPSLVPQDIQDRVRQWMWPQTAASPTIVATDIPSRGTGFFAGVEYQSYYHPNDLQFNPSALLNVQAIGANWVVLTPSWTYSRANPLLFSSLPGRDVFWADTLSMVSQARAIIDRAHAALAQFGVEAIAVLKISADHKTFTSASWEFRSA